MSNTSLAFCSLGALLTLYVVTAARCSKEARARLRTDSPRPRSRRVSADRRLNHWWRARQRSRKLS